MDESGGHYAKWNKPDRERQILYDFTHIWNIKTNKQTNTQKQNIWTNQTKQQQTNRCRVRVEYEMGKWDQLYGDGWKINVWW